MNDERDEMPKILREKYDKIISPRNIYNLDAFEGEIRKRKKKTLMRRISIIVSILIFIGGMLSVLLIYPKNKNIDTQELENVQGNGMITIKSDILDHLLANRKNKYLSIIRIESIEDSCVINNMGHSKVKFSVIKDYSNKLKEDSAVYIPGGIFKYNEIANIIEEKLDRDCLVNLVYENMHHLSSLEEGQEYVVGLYEEDGKLFVNLDFMYGFKKYNSENDTVEMNENTYEKLVIEDYMIK